VHQARVALRRLRTGLRVFAPFLPPRFVTHWGARWKATAVPLGALRNWDVLATETLPQLLGDEAQQPVWQAAQSWVQAQRHASHRDAQVALHQPGHALDMLAFTHAVLALPSAPSAGQGARLDRWARKSLRQQHATLMRRTRAALDEGPEGRHALRLRVKRLRYALDFLAGLLPEAALSSSRASLARAQNTLGRLNDLSTARTLLAQCPLPERDRLLQRVDAALARRLRQLPRAERALLRSDEPG
jgi:CHAD domain-containing protein